MENNLFNDIINELNKTGNYKWMEASPPYKLADLLTQLKKNELDSLRKRFEVKGASGLNKTDLTEVLAEAIPASYKQQLSNLDSSRYSILKKAAAGYADPDLAWNRKMLMDELFLFPVIDGGQKKLILPTELTGIFKAHDNAALADKVKENTLWISILTGMLYYYGVLEPEAAVDLVEKYTGNIDIERFMDVIECASLYYGDIEMTEVGFADAAVGSPEDLLQAQQARPGIPYYPFTKKQLLQVRGDDYYEKTPELKKLLQYLKQNYDMDQEELDELGSDLSLDMQSNIHLGQELSNLQEQFEFPSLKERNEFLSLVTKANNNTRKRSLKGHKITETQEFLKAENLSQKAENTKAGRNDPCPCGSGKKYKKCCGKN